MAVLGISGRFFGCNSERFGMSSITSDCLFSIREHYVYMYIVNYIGNSSPTIPNTTTTTTIKGMRSLVYALIASWAATWRYASMRRARSSSSMFDSISCL